MRRVISSFLVIAAVSLAAVSFSIAFFSDTETASNNSFTAGAIDLKVGNTSFYNGLPYPGPTQNPVSFSPRDITVERFLDFQDIKPNDWGADVISLTVTDNPSFACYALKITQNDDLTCTAPESAVDLNCTEPNIDLLDGDLANQVNFVFWADDGDNLLETSEVPKIIAQGPIAAVMPEIEGPLADTVNNVFGIPTPSPLPPNTPFYLAKAWCFGTLTAPGVPDNQLTVPPASMTKEELGITCDGSALNNAAQTDVVVGDITFSAIQSRNYVGFVCPLTAPAPLPI